MNFLQIISESTKKTIRDTSSNTVQNILEFRLLKFSNYQLTISDILLIAVIIVLCTYLLKLIGAILDRFVESKRIDNRNRITISTLLKYLVWVVAIILSLDVIGVKITILLAGSAALLVGLGLGLQQIFSDIVSGIFLLLEGSVKIGDIMEVDGIVGRVLKINLRTSEVLTRAGIIIIVPNHKFIVENVVNWSHNATTTRFTVTVGVSYNSDATLVKKILLECAISHGSIVDRKPYEAIVRLIDFGDSSLDFELLFWSKEGFSIENIKSDLRFMILSKFRKNGVEIPFPQRDLNLRTGFNFIEKEEVPPPAP
ncbi:MAG: small-conductance mechanosensitive channel [Spirosomataceae bacterium]|jgi:small-conductance mechanosensitive channel